jgi:hypothetical protein
VFPDDPFGGHEKRISMTKPRLLLVLPALTSRPETNRRIGVVKYACLVLAVCALIAIATVGQTFNTLAKFKDTNGSAPGALVQGVDGNFYGTTGAGGDAAN